MDTLQNIYISIAALITYIITIGKGIGIVLLIIIGLQIIKLLRLIIIERELQLYKKRNNINTPEE